MEQCQEAPGRDLTGDGCNAWQESSPPGCTRFDGRRSPLVWGWFWNGARSPRTSTFGSQCPCQRQVVEPSFRARSSIKNSTKFSASGRPGSGGSTRLRLTTRRTSASRLAGSGRQCCLGRTMTMRPYTGTVPSTLSVLALTMGSPASIHTASQVRGGSVLAFSRGVRARHCASVEREAHARGRPES